MNMPPSVEEPISVQLSPRDLLFEHYSKRCDKIDAQSMEKIAWFHKYASSSYYEPIKFHDRADKILEIGCSRGYLLSVFQDWGFTNLHGIDLSPNDIIQAQKFFPDIHFETADVFDYLPLHKNSYDIIVAKATLEHIEKGRIFEFLEKCYDSLNDDGLLIIDVPNMDWLFASHERYMDFTHEVGFTCTSLEQVMSEFFPVVKVNAIDFYIDNPKKIKNYLKKVLRFLIRKFIIRLIDFADPEGFGTLNPIWERSIVGLGYKV